MYESVAKLPCGKVTVAKLPCGKVTGNREFIEIFAQRFYYFENPFPKFFALNLLFQDTSYSLALKYLSFSVLHFIIIISGSKSVKFAQKFRIILKFLTLEGTLISTITSPVVWNRDKRTEILSTRSLVQYFKMKIQSDSAKKG